MTAEAQAAQPASEDNAHRDEGGSDVLDEANAEAGRDAEQAPSSDEWGAPSDEGDQDWNDLEPAPQSGKDTSERMPAQAYEGVPDIKLRRSPVRLAIQGALALIGLGVFIYLIILLRDGRNGGLALGLVLLLAVILIIEILLVEPIYRRLTRAPPILALRDDGETFVVGCPGCGTVFSLSEEAIEQGTFACENCGRPGYVADRNLNEQAIREERCTTCGNVYLEYQEFSECPACHTYNQY